MSGMEAEIVTYVKLKRSPSSSNPLEFWKASLTLVLDVT